VSFIYFADKQLREFDNFGTKILVWTIYFFVKNKLWTIYIFAEKQLRERDIIYFRYEHPTASTWTYNNNSS
jgi:hypothetical protein